MVSWRSALVLGFLTWLAPFVLGFLAFPLRESARPLFESVMAVGVTATAIVAGLAYLRRAGSAGIAEGILVGIVWLVMCVAIDAPLFLFGGPMKMTFAEYAGDIGLTYAGIPIVTWGLAAVRSSKIRGTTAHVPK